MTDKKHFTIHNVYATMLGTDITLTFRLNERFDNIRGRNAIPNSPKAYVSYTLHTSTGEVKKSYKYEGNNCSFSNYDTLLAGLVGAGADDYRFPPDKATTCMMDFWRLADAESEKYASELFPVLQQMREAYPDQGDALHELDNRKTDICINGSYNGWID